MIVVTQCATQLWDWQRFICHRIDLKVLKYKTNPGCWVNKLGYLWCVAGTAEFFSENLQCSVRTRFPNTTQYVNNYFSVCIISNSNILLAEKYWFQYLLEMTIKTKPVFFFNSCLASIPKRKSFRRIKDQINVKLIRKY